MVCVAAFIILCLISVVVAFLSLFRRDIGRKYWQVFKKAWSCVSKKVRLQKCETNFKDDVKNTLLRKIVLKRPDLVKPLSVIIEIISVLIVVITIWSLIIAIKSLFALWVFGTCNVSQPSHCGLGAEACAIDDEDPKNPAEYIGRKVSEWGEIFNSIPDRLRHWRADDYLPGVTVFAKKVNAPLALDIIDPGCSACMQSYKNQLSSGFFDTNYTALILYPIKLPDGNYKFKNSGLIARYYYASALFAETHPKSSQLPQQILNRLFTGFNAEHINYQALFNDYLSSQEAEDLLKLWLRDFKLSEPDITEITNISRSDKITKLLAELDDIILNRIHVKGIPTLIYNGRKHYGLYK